MAALLFAMGTGGSTSPEEKVLYTRADLMEALTGQVQLRRAYTRQLRLPLPECAEGHFVCVEDAMYGQVYELSFSEEKLSRQRDGVLATDRTDRGSLLVALDLPKEDETAFEDACRAELAGLSPTAFSLPQAGMRYLDGALKQAVFERSARPAWICTQLAGTYQCEIRVSNSSYSADGKIAERAGREIARTIAGVPPDLMRTAPDIRAQEKTEARLRSVSTLAGLTWSDRIATLPPGATFSKHPLDGKKTGGSRDTMGDVYRGHEGRYGKTEREVRLPPASLELLEVPMWAGEWRFETTHETFGGTPGVTRAGSASVLAAVIPIADPLMDDLSRTRLPLTVPSERFVESALGLFEHRSKLDPGLVEEAFADPPIWPDGGDWLVVFCRDDGTARYGIAPFAGVAAVTNPREACAAIRRELPALP